MTLPTLTSEQFLLIQQVLNLSVATMGGAALLFVLLREQVGRPYRAALIVMAVAVGMACYHYTQILGSWTAAYAPAGTPPALIDRINAEANRILTDPAVVARLGELGAEPTPGSPKSFQDFTLAELAKWREVARAAELKLE